MNGGRPYNPPEPVVVPVEGGLSFIVINGTAYLATKYTDGTKKLLLYDSSIPTGPYTSGLEQAYFTITTSPGTTEQQPAVVPLSFEDTIQDIPEGYEAVNVEVVFTDYEYDETESLADWSAVLMVDNVRVSLVPFAYGDQAIVADI